MERLCSTLGSMQAETRKEYLHAKSLLDDRFYALDASDSYLNSWRERPH